MVNMSNDVDLQTIFSLKKTQENTVLSPVSLYDVTALLQQGSGGKSLDEITRVLHADAATTRERYSQLVKQLRVCLHLTFQNKAVSFSFD